MASTILNGDITVYYLDENRRKQLVWTGSAGETYTLNQVYSALADLFDETGQMDDGSVMSAETPVEYTIGIIDSGDNDPWYITYECMEHITGGALKTASWARVTDTNTGLIVVPVTSNAIVTGDIGNTITGATTGSGTLLDVLDVGTSTDYLVIRPATSASASDFTTNSQVLTCNGNTANQSGASSLTGEQIWANLYTIGTIENDTHIYLYQGTVSDAGRARIFSLPDATHDEDWWGDGHIDVCIYTKDFKTATFPIIDGGYIKAFARKGSTYYDSFETATSTTSGGRNPVPINTAVDLDNATGYKSITTTAVATDTFNVGDEILGGTSGARAIITQISGSSPTYTFHYYLVGDPLTDFQTAAETITDEETGNDGSATKDGNAPANQGPALSTWFTNDTAPSISFTAATADIDDDGTDEYYGITIDCNQNPLSEVYEWLKYITRNGATTTTNTDGIEGEQYVGAEAYLKYTGSVTGSITEGSDVTQETSGATGIVISHDTTNKVILLRDVRGTFATHATTHTLTDNDTSGTVEIDSAATNFAPNKQASFGSFPGGGTFFGARGVRLTDYVSADENNFSLVTVDGLTKARPTAYTLTVTNLVGTDETTTTDDRVAVFRLTGNGGEIDKTEFSAYGGEAIGTATLDVDTAIGQDVPGKTTGGVLRIRDASDNNANYRIRYSSWLNNGGAGTDGRFTLANIVVAAADAGTNTTTIVESGAFTNAKRGDIVVNHTRTEAVSYVVSVDDANTVTISPAITGQTTGDSIELNCVPIAIVTADDVFVPLIDQYATSSSASVNIITGGSTIWFRARVRNVAATTQIKPFESADTSISTANVSVQTVRTEDTIYA